MPGGLLQLVAYGAQDAYLSGNPQITFWKGLFKRHTNFAMEPFRINLTGQANWGVKHSAIVGRHADLLYSTYLEVVMPPGAEVNNAKQRLGYNLLKYVELDIGGQIIDRLYGEWLYLWDYLSSDGSQYSKLTRMVGGTDNSDINAPPLADGLVQIPAQSSCGIGGGNGYPPTTLYIPLYFFYTKNPGAALPLIALQYHEVKINIQWNDAKFVAGNFNSASSLPPPVQAAIYIDYIYLDTEERRRMAQQSHEYLIEQTQFNEEKQLTSANNRIDLTFNHPVKELVWIIQGSAYRDCVAAKKNQLSILKPFTYDFAFVYEQWLQINGQDRLDKRYGDYFSKVQPYQHHTGPAVTQPGIYCYSFALRPEEHQPSGTCNFSRIDTATLVMNLAYSPNPETDQLFDVRVYAVNYNILRVMSGMAGLAYSN